MRALKFKYIILLLCTLSSLNVFSQTNSSNSYRPQIGMIYSLWHCMANSAPNNTVITQSLTTKKWGPLGALHWRDVPQSSPVENYCLNRNPALLNLHLDQLKKARVDFLVINLPFFCSLPEKNESIEGCLSIDSDTKKNIDLLMEKAASTPGAPKIVFWVPFKGSLVDYVVEKMRQYPSTNYQHEGAPLLIASWIKERNFHTVEEKIKSLKSQFKIRKMWGMFGKNALESYGNDVWSFMEPCKGDFIKLSGNTHCLQYGTPEMTSVSSSYQETYITDKKTAAPRFGTRTLMRQLETAVSRKSKLIIFNSWNEWVDQRLCFNSSELKIENGIARCAQGASEFGPDGTPGFINQFTREYSRDIEPDSTYNETYRVFQHLVGLAKAGTLEVAPIPEPSPPAPAPAPAPSSPVNQAVNSGYFALNSNVQGANFRNSYSPDSVYVDGNTVLIGTATGTTNATGLTRIRIFVPPGTVQVGISSSAYLADEEGKVAVSFKNVPRASAGHISSNTQYSGKALQSALLERGEEIHFYAPPRSGGIMLLNSGVEKVAPIQSGGWLYLNFLSIPGGTILNMQTRVTVDKACYFRWYQQAQWDSEGNPKEGQNHQCN